MIKVLYTLLFQLLVVIIVSACAHHGGAVSHSGGDAASWGNYKCTAVNTVKGGHTSVGWSASESVARANAMDKCRTHSNNPKGCRILHCVNEM